MLKESPGPGPRALGREERLEIELGAELNHARTAATGVLVTIGSPVRVLRDRQRGGWVRIVPRPVHRHVVILILEVRMVEDVECFPSKLEIASFAGSQLDVLEQRHIPVLHASSPEDVTSASLRRSDGRKN